MRSHAAGQQILILTLPFEAILELLIGRRDAREIINAFQAVFFCTSRKDAWST